jgi:uncharacterized protein (DUF169 family)
MNRGARPEAQVVESQAFCGTARLYCIKKVDFEPASKGRRSAAGLSQAIDLEAEIAFPAGLARHMQGHGRQRCK